MTARYAIGIDLGTTHSALALAPLEAEPASLEVMRDRIAARGWDAVVPEHLQKFVL